MENKELDFNYQECIKSYDKIGEITYYNICNDKTTTMPWGVGGWFLFSFGILIILTTLVIIIGIIKAIID